MPVNEKWLTYDLPSLSEADTAQDVFNRVLQPHPDEHAAPCHPEAADLSFIAPAAWA